MKISRNYRKSTSSLALLFCICMAGLVQASSARIFVLSADDWAQPRNGQVIVSARHVKRIAQHGR